MQTEKRKRKKRKKNSTVEWGGRGRKRLSMQRKDNEQKKEIRDKKLIEKESK